MSGTIVSLYACTGHRKPMRQLQSVEAIGGLGLMGDIHAVRDSSRQVLLIEKETLDTLCLAPATVRENITTSGIDLMQMKPRQRFRIGTAVLEMTRSCSPCERMEEIRPGLSSDLEGKRGMLARVLESGLIRVGDSVTLLSSGR